NETPPAQRSTTSATAPRYAATARLRATGAPPTIAGTDRSGSASSVATSNACAAASAAAVRPPPIPARRSIPTSSAVAVAAPPGTTRLNATPERCAAAIGVQRLVCSAIRCSVQIETKLAASAGRMSDAHSGSRRESERQDEKTSTSFGKSRYSETPVRPSRIARRTIRRVVQVGGGVSIVAGATLASPKRVVGSAAPHG